MSKTFLATFALISTASAFTFIARPSVSNFSQRSRTSLPDVSSVLPLFSTPDFNNVDNLETIDANDLEDCKKVDDAVWRRGDLDNMDSPLDAGWRQTCESMIQSTANGCGVEIGGVTWDFGKITIEVPSTASSDDQSLLAKQLNEVFENVESDDPDVVDCLVKHSLEIRTPGSQNLIVTQQQFDAYKGFDVTISTVDPMKSNRILKGKLVGRDSMDVKITVNGRVVTVPVDFVKEVKLPNAKTEKGDPFN